MLKNTVDKWKKGLTEHKSYLARTLNKQDKLRDEFKEELKR
jgi:hypothetical protein